MRIFNEHSTSSPHTTGGDGGGQPGPPGQRGPPGIGFVLTKDGNYDIENLWMLKMVMEKMMLW